MHPRRGNFAIAALALGLGFACASSSRAGKAPASPSAAAVLAELATLVGAWEGVSASGRPSRVAYRVSAGDSVVVETWTQSGGREALTIYHLDRERLLATHYCPKGNQVRLRWTGGSAAAGIGFEFLDGTNLAVEGQSHQRSIRLRILADGTFERGETYVRNGSTKKEIAAEPSGAPIIYRRVEKADEL